MAKRVSIGKNRILEVEQHRFFPIIARHMPIGADPILLREVGGGIQAFLRYRSKELKALLAAN